MSASPLPFSTIIRISQGGFRFIDPILNIGFPQLSLPDLPVNEQEKGRKGYSAQLIV
ncbi:MAG TPA: hypothetical protein VK543_14335 [Puia sp.]|nr:hypothetical protein [Puia sp.]